MSSSTLTLVYIVTCVWSCLCDHAVVSDDSMPVVMMTFTLQVDGDDTVALQSVLECDEERERLLAKERELTSKTQSRWVFKWSL